VKAKFQLVMEEHKGQLLLSVAGAVSSGLLAWLGNVTKNDVAIMTGILSGVISALAGFPIMVENWRQFLKRRRH
jgi:hypothetical protein